MGIIKILCKLDVFCRTFEVEGTFSALCFILYMTVGHILWSKIIKFMWLTPRYGDAFFWPKMSSIFTKKFRKHCLHACSFLWVWRYDDVSLYNVFNICRSYAILRFLKMKSDYNCPKWRELWSENVSNLFPPPDMHAKYFL